MKRGVCRARLSAWLKRLIEFNTGLSLRWCKRFIALPSLADKSSLNAETWKYFSFKPIELNMARLQSQIWVTVWLINHMVHWSYDMIHADLGLQPHLMKPLIYTATPRTYFTAHQKAENQISQIHFKKTRWNCTITRSKSTS